MCYKQGITLSAQIPHALNAVNLILGYIIMFLTNESETTKVSLSVCGHFWILIYNGKQIWILDSRYDK